LGKNNSDELNARKFSRRAQNVFLAAASLALSALAAGCTQTVKQEVVSDIRPVRTITVQKQETYETASLTGDIRAGDQAALAFRIGGRMIERPVNNGDQIKTGQTIAKLEPLDEMNALRSAQANLNSVRGILTRAQNDFNRQQTLLRQGHTTRVRFDEAQQQLQTAQSNVKDAEAQLRIAEDRVSFTELKSDGPGIVTAVEAEPGEVVQAGQTIVRLARDGGRDAVFDMPRSILQAAPRDMEVAVRLVDEPSVQAVGHIREIAPQANPITRNFQVKVGLVDPPAAMKLGSTVTGTIKLNPAPLISVPATALTAFDSRPAVWVVDGSNNSVSLRNVEVQRYEPASVMISSGLENGDVVVTAGIQSLYPGRKVRSLGEPAS
jgi:RND family efflux transporter MFP subunit